MMVSCILLAAGSGRRMEQEENKIFFKLGRYSSLQWCCKHIAEAESIDELVVVAAEGEENRVRGEVEALALRLPFVVVKGGTERQDSVVAGIRGSRKDAQIYVIHDGARPVASASLFEKVVEAAKREGAAAPAIPVKDTIKKTDIDGLVEETLQRDSLRAVQTPQAIHRALYEKALTYAKEKSFSATDDVALVEHMGEPVRLITGDYRNIKLTTPEDIEPIKSFLGVKRPMMRVGYGYDIHKLKPGRPCILGGVEIKSNLGPDGHSDGDVVVHAVMDALLGGAGLFDIGYYFPPSEEKYKNISSLVLLTEVCRLLKEKKITPYNVDITVIAEVPKLQPHISEMKMHLSRILSLPKERIGIKATTQEGLGPIGNKEGIIAQAVVSLMESEEY